VKGHSKLHGRRRWFLLVTKSKGNKWVDYFANMVKLAKQTTLPLPHHKIYK
jgi:hypothetical protein